MTTSDNQNNLLDIIIKSKDHLMIDTTGYGLYFADILDKNGLKITRVNPVSGSKCSLFRVDSNGL